MEEDSKVETPKNGATKLPLNIAMLGSKFMGRAHSNAWSSVAHFFPVEREPRLHTVAGRNVDDLRIFARRWGFEHFTTDWRTAVSHDHVDLVDIVTPNNLHAEQAMAALEAGRHVACEKPLASSLADAHQMAVAAANSIASTFVWFSYRRTPAVALAHRLVKQGRLGRVYHARASYLQSWGGPETPLLWRFVGDQAGSGAHGDLNAHIIDAVRFITGEEITVVEGAIEHTFISERAVVDEVADGLTVSSTNQSARFAPSTVDDAVMFLARLSGGGIASFEASRLATGYHNSNRFEIHGENGAVRFDFERMNELEFYDATADGLTAGWTTIDATRAEDGHPYAEHWWPDSHGLGYEHTFVNQAADIITMLDGGEPVVPMPDFADALQTQRVLDAAIRSARERAPIVVSQDMSST